ELGSSVSAGERQRLGLARIFLKQADLILLDEPTSNLDSLNEAIILKSLKEHQKDKTIVLVSHRPQTLKIADQILHMENGRAC
ncbi:MAG: ATP-binding cassette domain-containing protein, partial [Erysipelotrichaceae bacterium]|nr:ATP-binding cassette domain-containing protein [Erysipelotrichaceae bacterium]